jgi:hypothetical protein
MSHVTIRKPSVINASVVLVERDVVRKADRTMDEQQLIAMLRDLPLPITLTAREGKYSWECYAERSSSSTLLESLHSALRYLQMLILEAPPAIDKHEPVITTSEEMYYCGACRRPMPMSHFPHYRPMPFQEQRYQVASPRYSQQESNVDIDSYEGLDISVQSCLE